MKKWYIQVQTKFMGDIIIDIDPIEGTHEEVMENMNDMVFVKSIGIHETFYFENYKLIDADQMDTPKYAI